MTIDTGKVILFRMDLKELTFLHSLLNPTRAGKS